MSVGNKTLDGRNKYSRVHTKDTNLGTHCALFQPVVFMSSSLQLFLTQFIPLGCSPTLQLSLTHTARCCTQQPLTVCVLRVLLFSVQGGKYGPIIIFKIFQSMPVITTWKYDKIAHLIFGSPTLNQVLLPEAVKYICCIAFHIPTTQPDGESYLQGNFCNIWSCRKSIKFCGSTFLTHDAFLLKHTVIQGEIPSLPQELPKHMRVSCVRNLLSSSPHTE